MTATGHWLPIVKPHIVIQFSGLGVRISIATNFALERIFYVAKTERKGRTKAELDEIIRWLTGYSEAAFKKVPVEQTDFETFFAKHHT